MDAPAKTLVELFLQRVSPTPHRLALRYRKQDVIHDLTWHEIAEDVQRTVGGLRAAGIAPGDRVAQLSENRYEWIVADLAILLAQAIHVPIHCAAGGGSAAAPSRAQRRAMLFVSGVQQQVKVESVADVATPGPEAGVL